MRPYRSITGPLVLILVGCVFLVHTLSPSMRLFDLWSRYWPWLLIGWGLVGLIEVCVQFSLNRQVPVSSVSGGGWTLAVLICLLGFSTFEAHRADNWWRQAGFERSMEAFGSDHEFSFDPQQRTVGRTPHLIIENFRGDATITGTDGQSISVSGHKNIRAVNKQEADQVNTQSAVEVTTKGNSVVIRCNQDKVRGQATVTTALEISVPKGASVEATGSRGDFEVSGLSGDVDLSSENAGVRLQNVTGNVKVETRRSDLIRCTNVGGTVDLRGHGTDVELSQVGGPVTISGSYSGSVALRNLAKPVKVENLRTEFSVQQIPGEVRLERGSVSMRNVVGPTQLTTRTSDVSLDDYTGGLELSADKGDIELRPGHLPLGRTTIHARSGNIELTVPQSAGFVIKASTERGDISNEFGGGLSQRAEGRGARLEGSVGDGPDVNLVTNQGSITVRKASGEETPGKVAFSRVTPGLRALVAHP